MSEHVIEVQDHTFDQNVLQPTQPVIVDFLAPWCGPCKAMAPAFEALAESYQDRMVFAKCNVDDCPSVASRFGIKSIPTLMIFQGGKAIDSITGIVSSAALENAIDRALAGDTIPATFIVN
jgi:thioredoxin 1